MDTLYLGFLYFDNSLRSIKTGLASFFKPKRSFKDGFGVHSVRVFSKFSLDAYYEPLLWFMIYYNLNVYSKIIHRLTHLFEYMGHH